MAWSFVAAATIATASPSVRTLSSHRIGRSATWYLSLFVPLMSFAVITPATPGIAAAAAVSMPRIRACAWGLRTTAISRAPGRRMSAPKSAVPVALAMALGRGNEVPISGASAAGMRSAGAISPRMNRPASWIASMIFT